MTTILYELKNLDKITRIKANDITIKITPDDEGKGISIGSNIKNVTLYFSDSGTTKYNLSNFKYEKVGRNLEITTITGIPGQKFVLNNYFTSAAASSLATKSVIKYIKFDKEGLTSPTALFDFLSVADIEGATVSYNPNAKGIVAGTPFGDVINGEDMNTTAFRNYGKNNRGLTINADTGADNITGTIYNDTITGGLGENIINFDYEKGFGLDIVKLTKGEILTLNFTIGATPVSIDNEDIQYVKEGNHLVITNKNYQNDQVVLQNFFKNLATVSIGNEKITDYLTTGAGVLNILGARKIAGTDYGDYIVGSTAADTITSGKGKDEITAGLRNDTIKLGEGDKIVNIDYADGNDTITLASTDSLKLYIDDETGSPATNLVYAKSTNQKDLYIYRDNNQYTLIKNYYDADGNPITDLKVNDSPVTANAVIYNLAKNNRLTIGSAESETNPGNFVLGSKNDTVTVNSGENYINLLGGNDTVTFGADYTNDTIIKTAGGTDNIKFLGANSADDIDVVKDGNNIEIQTFGDSHSTVTIKDYKDITSTVNVKDKNNKVVTTIKSGSGKIVGTAGRDIIIGSAKNDTITGGKGDDVIYTRGGNDTLVLTGNYGNDEIYSEKNMDTDKVTLKVNSFDYEINKSYDPDEKDFVYSSSEKDSVTYKNFFDTTANTADLWINIGKKNIHIVNASNGNYYNSQNNDNNLVFLTDEDAQVYDGATTKKGLNTIVSRNNASTFNYNDGYEKYVDEGNKNTTYNVNISSTTLLEIEDRGGSDTLNLDNTSGNLNLFFNVDLDSTIDDDGYLIYNNHNFDYNHVMAVTRGDTTGSVSVIEYDKDEHNKPIDPQFGKIETVNIKDIEDIDMDGWRTYISEKVQDWLETNNKKSVLDVLTLRQTAANKKLINSLVNVYKEATYQNYILSKLNQSDLSFEKSCDDLLVYDNSGATPTLVATTEDYFKTNNHTSVYYAKDANGDVQKYDIPIAIKNAAKVDTYTFASESDITISELDNTKTNKLIFNDIYYKDFYTKDDGTGHYTAGDPLIYKGGQGTGAKESDWKNGGDGLTVGNVYIEDISDYKGEINIQTKDGTRNIIVDSGEFNGTFESEIIVGSNNADIINAKGGDDLVYSGAGDDALTFEKSAGGRATGKNTAGMVVIGGSDYMPKHEYDAISVYDTAGSDTYNTTLDVGLYIEDIKGDNSDTDTVNITASDVTANDIRFMFDVYNPKYLADPTLERPTFYEDLLITSKDEYDNMKNTLQEKMMSGQIGSTTAEIMESMQGSFGYVWIDDQYSDAQKIESVNLNGNALSVDIDYSKYTLPTNKMALAMQVATQPYIQTIYQVVATWLDRKGYDSAWSVVNNDTTVGKEDTQQLFAIYGSSTTDLIDMYNQLNQS